MSKPIEIIFILSSMITDATLCHFCSHFTFSYYLIKCFNSKRWCFFFDDFLMSQLSELPYDYQNLHLDTINFEMFVLSFNTIDEELKFPPLFLLSKALFLALIFKRRLPQSKPQKTSVFIPKQLA